MKLSTDFFTFAFAFLAANAYSPWAVGPHRDHHTGEETHASNSDCRDGSLHTALCVPTAAQDLTSPQKNAIRAAKDYLSFAGFSRRGLIEQLSSPFGDDYDVGDATVAVDRLSVDWNEQAVRSAKDYLSFSGFSCRGLIKQLSSEAGDKYTKSEATYGAQQAGAC